MCGRFTLTAAPQRLRAHFGLSRTPSEMAARYNIAPTQPVLVIPNRLPREAATVRWGLIPYWATEGAGSARMINTRAETLASRPAFRAALERRRCLIPADGFYEWRREGRRRAPFYLRPRDGGLIAFAGLWDTWRAPAGDRIASCTIITTAANDVVGTIHDRMPVILPPDAYDAWLAPAVRRADAFLPLLAPCPTAWIEAYPVSDLVSSPAHDGAECIEPLGAATDAISSHSDRPE